MYINNNQISYQKSDNLTNFLNSKKDGVFYIGHASILVRLNNKKFIFDFIEHSNFYNNSWCFFPSQIIDKRLLEIDGAFVSHVHQDHYDPFFLKKLKKKNIPIYILDGRSGFNKLLRKEKIDFVKLPYKKKFYIDKNIWIYGSLHEYNDIDSSLLISNDNLSVYHGNDNFITKKSLSPFKNRVGNVDVGCIPFAFIHYYPYLLDRVPIKEIRKEGRRLENQFMNYGISQTKILKPKIIIPFGSNLFHSDNPNSIMNKAVATPIDFVNYAKKKHRKYSNNYKAMLSGSYCLKENGKVKSFYEKISAKKFNLELRKFINRNNSVKIKKDYIRQIKINKKYLKLIKNKLLNNKSKIRHQIIVGSFDKSKSKICINLYNNKVTVYNKKTLPNNCHYFKVQLKEYNMWLTGKLTFEEVLGTRRFRYIRNPNNYSVKIMQLYTNYL